MSTQREQQDRQHQAVTQPGAGAAGRAGADHAADRLLDAFERSESPVCVGVDPVLERLPEACRGRDAARSADAGAEAIADFVRGIIDAVAPHVPCVKFQSACFERFGAAGVAVLHESIRLAHDAGLEVILDAKRGDIGISAEHYAAAAFEGPGECDWLTVNSYLGDDGIRPFLRPGHGAFALVRTSNPGGDRVQSCVLDDGRAVAEAVADMVAEIGDETIGERGYSALGAVVGATRPDDAARLRQRMPRQIFLVPGFGAQGGGVADVLPCFNEDRRGAIITASRSVIYAFEKDRSQSWRDAVAAAAHDFAKAIRTGLRSS